MSPITVAKTVMDKFPELKEFSAAQLRIVREVIRETVTISKADTMSPSETDRLFKRLVPDSGKPSAALRAYRSRVGLTQRALSKKCGIPQPHISAMENESRPIGLSTAKKLALALGIDYRKLL